jgi:hypothetical protein
MQNSSPALSYRSSAPLVILGATAGLIALLAMRVAYYDALGLESHIHAAVAYYFLPILLAALLVIALPLEWLLRIVIKPCTSIQAVAFGVIHATLFTWWAFPNHWYVVALANPLIFRVLVRFALLKNTR